MTTQQTLDTRWKRIRMWVLFQGAHYGKYALVLLAIPAAINPLFAFLLLVPLMAITVFVSACLLKRLLHTFRTPSDTSCHLPRWQGRLRTGIVWLLSLSSSNVNSRSGFGVPHFPLLASGEGATRSGGGGVLNQKRCNTDIYKHALSAYVDRETAIKARHEAVMRVQTKRQANLPPNHDELTLTQAEIPPYGDVIKRYMFLGVFFVPVHLISGYIARAKKQSLAAREAFEKVTLTDPNGLHAVIARRELAS